MLLNPYRFGGGGAAVWPPAAGASSVLVDDPNYASCTALLHGNGSNGSTSFVDQIGNAWTANGNAQISISSPLYGTASMLFDGSGDYLSATAPNIIGTGDFTIRAKIRIASLSADGEIFCIGVVSNTSAFDLVFEYKTTGALRGSIQNGSGTANVDITTAAGLLGAGDYDVAFAAEGATARLYIDGVQQQSGAITGTRVQSLSDVRIGHLATAVPRWFNGRIKGLQVYSGVCLYPGGTTFTPPAAADRPSLPALTYVSSFATSVTTVTDAQGVADDGTNLYYSNSTTLYKYSKAGSLITSRSTTGDTPTTRTQINGIFYRGGVLYVSIAYYTGGVGTSYISEYDPNTLAPLGVVHLLDTSTMPEAFSEGLTWYKGFWWVAFHATKKVAVYTADFSARVALLDLGFTLSGSSGGYGSGQGYDGIDWWGDYLFCNVHETYNEKYLDVYLWNGTDMSKVSRIVRTRTVESQGLSFDPSDATVVRFAERNYSGNDGVAKRQFV